jgi:hypothetical protein
MLLPVAFCVPGTKNDCKIDICILIILLAMPNSVCRTPKLILWSGVLLQKLIISQLVKKFCIFFSSWVLGDF